MILNGITLKTASDTIYNNAKLTLTNTLSFGTYSSTGKMLTNIGATETSGADILNFDLSAMPGSTPGGKALISDWTRVDNAGSITISVSETQANGNYRIANSVMDFHFNVAVNNSFDEKVGTFYDGEGSFDVGNRTFHLGKNNAGNLFFSVTASGNTIALPQDMTVTASKDKLSWDLPATLGKYTVELSTDNFATFIAIQTEGDSFDIGDLPAGIYHCRTRYENGESSGDKVNHRGHLPGEQLFQLQ